MKIIINEEKILEYMKKNGVKNYMQLCRECGINYGTFISAKCRRTTSKEIFWLIAERLNCHVEELQVADWTK